jgi:hypothetical protein
MRLQIVCLSVVFLALACAFGFSQTTVLTSSGDGVRPTPDPDTTQILDSLRHPTHAEVEANDITVPGGEVTRCEGYINGNRTESTCSSQVRLNGVHQLVLHFSLNGESIRVTAGCSPLAGDRDCHTFGELGDPFSLACGPAADPKVRVCTTKGSGTFQIEADRKKHKYFVYPVQGGKANRRYKIPLAAVNEKTVVMD